MADTPKQATAYTAEGKTIPPEDTAAAVREGRGFFQKGATVIARNPNGEIVTVDSRDARLPGYTVATDQQIKQHRLKRDAESAGGIATTAVEGGVRGLSLGFLEPSALYTPEEREASLARQRYNPGVHAAGEITGNIVGGVAAGALTGGAGAAAAAEATAARLAARQAARLALAPWSAADALGGLAQRGVARLAGEGLVGKTLGTAARAATEGAVMGAGHEVSQSILEDKPLTAERLLAGMGENAAGGALLGGGVGLLGHGLSSAGKSVLGRVLEGKTLETAVRDFAEKRSFKQVVGNARKFFDEATAHGSDMARPQRIGRKLLDAAIPDETGAAIKVLSERTEEAASRLKAVAAEMDGAGVRVNNPKILSTVDDQIAKIREVPSAAFQRVARTIEKEIKPFRTAVENGQDFSFSELWKFRQKLDETIKWEKRAGGPAEEALRDMVGAFRSELDDSIERAVVSDVAAVAPVGGAVPTSMAAPADDVLGQLDDFGGVGRAANDLTPQGRVSEDLLGRWKAAKEDYADFNLAKRAAKDLDLRNEKNRFISPSDYGTGGMAGVLVGVLTGGGLGALAGVATNAAVSVAHKYVRERGAGMLAKLADRSANVAGRMDLAARAAAMVAPLKRPIVPATQNLHQLFERYTGALALSDEETAERLGRVTSDLADHPDVAQVVMRTMLEDRAYLRSLEPQPTTNINNTLTPKAAQPSYSFDQKKRFVDAAQALDNPLSVFDDLARGELPLVKIETLKIRRPLLWGEMRDSVARHAVTRETALPYSRRILLGSAFDFPADWSQLNVAAIQAVVAPPPKSKNDPRGAPSKVNPDPGKGMAPGGF
jgi:hypothetical protein